MAPVTPPAGPLMGRTRQCTVRYWIGQRNAEGRETHKESFRCIRDQRHAEAHLFFTSQGGVTWPRATEPAQS